MMYHLKFSLTGGASCSVGCSPPGSCASGICSSTAMVRAPSSSICVDFFWCVSSARRELDSWLLVFGEVLNQPGDALPEHVIGHCKVSGEDEHGDDYDRGGGLDLGAGRCDHLAHLAAHVLEELHQLSRP